MRSKHIVFAGFIFILSAGAVIAAVMGMSQPISMTNNEPIITLTPTTTTELPPVTPQEEQMATATIPTFDETATSSATGTPESLPTTTSQVL